MSNPKYQYNLSNDDSGEDYTKEVIAADEEQAIEGAFGLIGSEEDSGFTTTVTEVDESEDE